MTNPPRLVVHIIYRLAIGGLENGLVNLINRMPVDRFRHAVICLAGYTDFRDRIQRPDVTVYSLEKRPGKDLAMYWRCFRLLRRLRPAIVHTRNLGTVDLQWTALAAGVRARVHGEHGWEATDPQGLNRRSVLIRRACRRAIQRYVALSTDLASWLTSVIGVPQSRITRICNGVDMERFTPHGPLPADVPWRSANSKPFVFGTIGRLDAIKNQRGLLDAFAQLTAVPDALPRERLRLIIAGGGPLADDLRAHAERLGISDLVWFPGPRNDVPELLRACDVFVLPSMNEGISNTILEAMACARPVIAGRVGGNPELVEDENTGTLYDAQDARQLLAALVRYCQSDLAARQGAAARIRAQRFFSLESMVAGYGALYQSLLNT